MPSDHASTPPLLRVQNLSITHDGNPTPSPRDVSFSVERGEVVLILGPSGAGKSTLALALNGLIPHDIPVDISGSVTVSPTPGTSLTAPEATPAELSPHVAMVFQDPDAQLVTGSVYDEVAFGLENLCFDVAEIHARVEASLRRVGLWDRRRTNPDDLSGGGRQRLAIACALAMRSSVLVLDEPTANLDPQGSEEVYAALADVVADGERGVVLVEHNLDAAMPIVTRVLVLGDNGSLLADGSPNAVLRGRADELHALGVWLPEATLAALALRAHGIRLDPLPLTSIELAAALPARTGVASPVQSDPRAPRDSIATARLLTFERDQRAVLRDVSLDIASGSFTAIIGANGAGKTTLLQLLSGVIKPPRGTVMMAGVDPARTSATKLSSRVGFVFQNPEHQFMTSRVYDELAYELRAQKLPAAEVEARVSDMLERFGLSDKREVHPFLLSGGQKRRLSVGTALLSGAEVLALDEPTFGQDRARVRELLDLLEQLRADGTTIIVVTHDMQLVADYATHTIALANGRVLASGLTPDVWADADALIETGMRMPPVQRALRSRNDYADVWHLADVWGGER